MSTLIGNQAPDFTAPAVMADGSINNEFSLADLRVTGGKKGRLEILGQLDLAPQDPSGLFFARWGPLSAAVSLAEGERDWKLTASRRWYDAGAVAYRAARSARAATR